MTKPHRPVKVTVGFDPASWLLFIGCLPFVAFFYLLFFVTHPKQQIKKAAKISGKVLNATGQALHRLDSHAARSFQSSRFAQSMREFLADSP